MTLATIDPLAILLVLLAFVVASLLILSRFSNVITGPVGTVTEDALNQLYDALPSGVLRYPANCDTAAKRDAYAQGFAAASSIAIRWATNQRYGTTAPPPPQTGPRWLVLDGESITFHTTATEARRKAAEALAKWRDCAALFNHWPDEVEDVAWGMILESAAPYAIPANKLYAQEFQAAPPRPCDYRLADTLMAQPESPV